MNTQGRLLILGGIFGALAVAIGAFGAHALKTILIENHRTETFELAVRYQFYHALAILILGMLAEKYNSKWIAWAGIFFASGIILFSGSLYILALSGVTILGAVTPIGGVFLIGGWLTFIIAIRR